MTREIYDVQAITQYLLGSLAEDESVRFRLEDGTEIHVYGPRDEFHEFFGTAPVVGFLVDDVASARLEMEAAGIEFIGPTQHGESERWSHFLGADGNVYELLSRG